MVFAQAAVWQVQHGAPLEGLQAGRGNEAGDGHRLFNELRDEGGETTTCSEAPTNRDSSEANHHSSSQTHISVLCEVLLNADPHSLQGCLPFLWTLVQLPLQPLDVLQAATTTGVRRKHNQGEPLRSQLVSQPEVW